MASFSAYLPAVDAAALDRACESAARAARAGGDARTLDQLRADALSTMAIQSLLAGSIGSEGHTDDVFRFDQDRAKVRVTATEQAQRGERGVCAADGLRWLTSTPSGRAGQDSPYEDSPALTGCVAGVDVPELDGYGAIPPVVIPPLLGYRWITVETPVDLGEEPPAATGYRPTAELDRWARRRDRVCQAPGCSVSAWSCDLDHVVPFPRGSTSAGNLRALCRHHHRMKTLGGHDYWINDDGTLTWRTAAGHLIHSRADGRVQLEGWPAPATGIRPEDLDLSPNEGPDPLELEETDDDALAYQHHAARLIPPTDPHAHQLA